LDDIGATKIEVINLGESPWTIGAYLEPQEGTFSGTGGGKYRGPLGQGSTAQAAWGDILGIIDPSSSTLAPSF
jgi:hypothetical protein